MDGKTRRPFAALALLAALAGGSALAAEPAPDLAKHVTIRRTSYGVPHILGDSFAAAGFGFGYAQAQDHWPSIMRLVLAARGELSKNFGKEHVEADFWSKQYRVRERAIETFHKLDPDYRDLAEGFAQGFSHFVRVHRAELPDWVQPITAHDVASHGMTGVMRFAFDRGGIIQKFLASRKKAQAAMAEPEAPDAETGSNMWAFAPGRTKSGLAILMGNPHQPWAPVSTYYEAHMTIPGKLDFYGSTYIGRPVLTSGFNERLGWSHTVNYPDLEEIYELALDPAHPDCYLFDGGSVPMRREDATIEIKDGGQMRKETRTFWHTPLGPVILREEGKVFVIKSACYEEYRSYEQWLRMSRARTLGEFREALDMLAVPMFNICYADAEGNIYYLYNGEVPMLPGPSHEAESVPAARSSEIWTRFHPVRDLPQLLNPPGGYVQNSNSPPYFTNLKAPLDINKFPPYFERHKLGLRTQHSLFLLDNDKKFSLEDVRDMKFSPRMDLAERVKPDLIAALKAAAPQPGDAEILAALEKWDNTVAAASRGGVLFADWWARYAKDIAAPLPDSYEKPWTPEDPMGSPRGLGNKARAVEAIRAAAEEAKKKWGAIDVAWGDVHRVRKGSADFPAGGGSGYLGCFRVLDFKKDADGKESVSGGDSWIFTTEFGKTPRAYSVVGYSQSEIEGSPHYNDQTELYAGNKMKPVAFTEAEIASQLLAAYRPGEEGPAK